MAKQTPARSADNSMLPLPAAFAALDASTEAVRSSGGAAPYVAFTSDRSGVDFAMLVREQVGSVAPGTPVLSDGETVRALNTAQTLLLAEFCFFADIRYEDGSVEMVRAAAEAGDGLAECALAYTMHIFDDGTVSFGISRMSRNQAAWVRDLISAIRHAGTPAFLDGVAKQNPQLAKAMVGVPPRFRVSGQINGRPKKGGGKFPYIATSCRGRALNARTWQAIGAALGDADTNAKMGELLEVFESRRDAIKRRF